MLLMGICHLGKSEATQNVERTHGQRQWEGRIESGRCGVVGRAGESNGGGGKWGQL